MFNRTFPILLFALFFAASCTHTDTHVFFSPNGSGKVAEGELDSDDPYDVEQLKEQYKSLLAPFTCTFEKKRLPRLDPDADKLFQYAVWLEDNQLRGTTFFSLFTDREINFVEYQKSAWLYRLAAATGHWKASRRLAEMLMNSKKYDFSAQVRQGKTLEEIIGTNPDTIAEDLIRRGIPYGYYLKGTLLEKRYKKDIAALRHIRIAADMGNPDAQNILWKNMAKMVDILDLQDMKPKVFDIAKQTTRCAADQGHGEAANALGDFLQHTALTSEQADERTRFYKEAVKYFQIAVKAGNWDSTEKLRQGFISPQSDSNLNLEYIGLSEDKERSDRYEKIQASFQKHQWFQPTVEELDRIVPLPPAKLPPWDGKLDWVKKWEKNEAPPLLSEKRIAEMARAKGLEPVFEPKLSSIQQLRLPFTCVHEKNRLPPLDPEADMLYRHADWLYKKNGSDPCQCDPKVERLHRIAIAWGHWEAVKYFANDLQWAHSNGNVELVTYLADVAEDLIRRDIPYGYYLKGIVLPRSELAESNDCAQDDKECKEQAGDKAWDTYLKRKDGATRYFRKAADLGNPEAQHRLGSDDLLGEEKLGPEMLRCAAEQGNSKAVEEEMYRMAAILRNAGELQRAGRHDMANEEGYDEVIQFLRVKAKEFDLLAADTLLGAFIGKRQSMLFEEDGFKRISMILFKLQGLDTVTIDDIFRVFQLPSDQLPSLETIFKQMPQNHEGAKNDDPPPLPNEERIAEMARAKGLDPETGLPVKTAAKIGAK